MNSLNFYRVLVILNGAVPLFVLLWDTYRSQLGANPVNYALHVTGILSLVFLMLSLSMTPMRWVTLWGGWIAFRRPLGLFGFGYSVLHVFIYVGFDRNMSLISTVQEIWSRRFLQVGTAAIFLMVPLAITSTNWMIRELGPKNWKRLHRFAYLVAILGVLHYYLLVKSDIRQPVAFAVVLSGLLGTRIARKLYDLRHATSPKPKHRTSDPLSATRKTGTFWKGELLITAIRQETPNVKTFTLATSDGSKLPFDYLPGQYLNLHLEIQGKQVRRSYTIASTPTRGQNCELTIKREPHGLSSCYLHDSVRVGDRLRVNAPAGKFVFTGAQSDSVLMIAGGVGITPLMSMVRFLTDQAWAGEIYLLIVVKTEQDIIFRDEIADLQTRFSNLHVCITLTRLNLGNSDWQGENGRASVALIKKCVPNLLAIPVYLCGPNSMMDATRQLLLDAGVSELRIKTEAFVSPRETASATDAMTRERDDNSLLDNDCRNVFFNKSKSHLDVPRGVSILEAAEQLSLELPFDCRSGICGQCKVRLIKGTVSMDIQDALSSGELEQGFVLACQAHAISDVVVDA